MLFLNFVILYSLLILSIIGYGLFFSVYLTKYNKINLNDISIGLVGIFGVFFLTLISFATNIFFPHDNLHNLIIILLGLIMSYILIKKIKLKSNFKYLFFSYLISFFYLFLFKNHDDFPYYHLSFTSNLTDNKIEFGLGHFEVAFNHVSSIFFFNSLFKTIFTADFFYQIGQISIIIFANTYLLQKLFENKKKTELNLTFYLSLFCFFFINIFFYRLAEHGTDRSAQILFFLCFIFICDLIKNKNFFNQTFEVLLILFTLIISLKSFYIIYSLFLILLLFHFFKLNKIFITLKNIPIIFVCALMFAFVLLNNIAYSGCLIYPVVSTCFENLFWSFGKDKVQGYMIWYELWSKAGATPDSRVDNINDYLSNFSWVNNWFEAYFFNKVSDFLLGVLTLIIVILLFFKPKKLSFKNFNNYNWIYIFLLILFFEWFINHPSLRYGGYVLVFLLLIFPISLILSNQRHNFFKNKKKIKALVFIGLVILSYRNIDRLIKENSIYNYNFIKNPYYLIEDKFYLMQNRKKELYKFTDNCKNKKVYNELSCVIKNGYFFYYRN